jgi:hypothetical protein
LAKEAEALLLLEAEDHVLAKHPDRFAAQRAVALLSKGYPIKLIGYRLVKPFRDPIGLGTLGLRPHYG